MRYLLVIALGLSACATGRLEAMDNGFIVTKNGKLVKAAHLPISIHASDGTDVEWVKAAVNWWNKALSKDGTPRIVFIAQTGHMSVPVYSDHYIMPESSVDGSYNDWWNPASLEGVYPLGRCTSEIDDRTGFIIKSTIELSYHLAWHDRTMIQALKNEMGHLLGLQDDVYSIDLNSVMSGKLLWNGQLTDGDFKRLQDAYTDI